LKASSSSSASASAPSMSSIYPPTPPTPSITPPSSGTPSSTTPIPIPNVSSAYLYPTRYSSTLAPSTGTTSSTTPAPSSGTSSPTTTPAPIGGVGLKSSKQRVGKGSILTDINHPLLYIDKKLLDNNMLSVKYKKNGNSHPKFKTVYISDDLKHAILKNNHNMKLEARENQILKNLILLIGSDKEKEPFKKDDDFNQKFKILLGQLRAGNDSKILRQELKQYILAGLQSNKLSRSVALDLMVELND
jgi:hypothetical protein